MQVNNPLYKNKCIHFISSIFTVDKGVVKVLLIRRKNEPYKDKWALVGGALYNNETLEICASRELKEKTGLDNVDLTLCNVFSKVDRSPVMRMVAVSYLGVVDIDRVKFLKETLKTSDCDWFAIDNIPNLAYDHNVILNDSLEKLKQEISKSNILKSLFPNGFTIPELQKTYESILGVTFDRRNFRRKLLSLDLIVDTNREIKFDGNKPAKVYEFNDKNDSVF